MKDSSTRLPHGPRHPRTDWSFIGSQTILGKHAPISSTWARFTSRMPRPAMTLSTVTFASSLLLSLVGAGAQIGMTRSHRIRGCPRRSRSSTIFDGCCFNDATVGRRGMSGHRQSQRRRRDIFVATGCQKLISSVGAAYSDVAPTELNHFAENILQRCRAYGAGEGLWLFRFPDGG